MVKITNFILIGLLFFVLISLSFSCKKKTNNIKIPSYISVDTIQMQTNYDIEGSNIHAITDCWVYVDGDSIGVFEVPFKVPVLANGDAKITIHGGIKKSGSDTKRVIYPFIHVFNVSEKLIEGEVTKIYPVFKYRPVDFILNEDFDNVGISFQKTDQSEVDIEIVSAPESLEGKSMMVTIGGDNKKFECISSNQYKLPKKNPVFLQVSFKSNAQFDFGFFALEAHEGDLSWVRNNVYIFKNTNNYWKTVFIDLDYHINMSKAIQFKLFFRALRKSVSDPEAKIYLDNIKLISYKQ